MRQLSKILLSFCLVAVALVASVFPVFSAVNDVPLEINSPDLVDSDFVKYFLFAHYDYGWSRVQLVVLTSDLIPFTVDFKVVGNNYQARVNTPDQNVSDFAITRMVYNVDTGQLQSIRTYQSVLTGQYSIYLNEATSREYFRSFGSSWNIPENQYFILPVVFNKDQTRFDAWTLLFTSLIGTLHQDLVSSNTTLTEVRNLIASQNAYISSIYNFLVNELSFVNSSSFASRINSGLNSIDGDLQAIYDKLFNEDVTVDSSINSSVAGTADDLYDSISLPSAELDEAITFGSGAVDGSVINPSAMAFVKNLLSETAFSSDTDNSGMQKISVVVVFSLLLGIALTFWRRSVA